MSERPDDQEKKEAPLEEEKTVSFRFPRYEKRSLITIICLFILPSAIYAFQYFPLNEPGKFLQNAFMIFTFFAYPWALIANTLVKWDILPWILVFTVLQACLMVFIHKNVRWIPKKALTIAVTIGMGNLLLTKILAWIVGMQGISG